MASAKVICLQLLLLILRIRAQLKSSSLIYPGSSLYPNSSSSSWLSPSGRFAFGFYPQGHGFAVGIWLTGKPDITVVWTANRNDQPVSSNSSVDFTKDGKLLLRTDQGEEKSVSRMYMNHNLSTSASMLDSGSFTMYGKNFEIIWESFQNPTDTILGGQNLSRITGAYLLTSSKSKFDQSSGGFRLELTYFGDLVTYPINHTAATEEQYWSILAGESELALKLSRGGVLQLSGYNKTLQTLARSSNSVGNETVIYRATLDADGILRLYSHRFETTGISNVTVEWSALKNQCEVKGICGFNSYCSSNSSKADCYCFPGFEFINPDMRSLGCYRSFNDKEGCKRKEPAVFYNVTKLENTNLGGLPYAKLSVNKEDCSKSCMHDCYCGAVLYLNGTCSKLKLPLMFGMKDQNSSAIVYVKWSSRNANLSIPRNTRPSISEIDDIESKKKLITIVAAILGSLTFLCLLITISCFLLYKVRVLRYQKLPGNSNFVPTQEFTLQSFTYNDLEQATDGFREELGRVGYGAVYKGAISEGTKIIAVKRLENPGKEEERKFRAEMAAVSRTHHRNLVPLLGFCMEGSKKLLVYEFMSKGSLIELLFNVERRPLWKERVRIALDVARGILYLHEECEIQIIHCNINIRNILLDDYWTAKISNFGLAKLLMPNQTETLAGVRGSRGYMAPEWQKDGLVTVKSDVYSFGVVLLEIICCRSNLEVNVLTADEMLLSTWVYNCFIARELKKLVGEEVDMSTLERMVKVGLLCIQYDPNLRPSMKHVILMLEGTMNIPFLPLPTPLVIA